MVVTIDLLKSPHSPPVPYADWPVLEIPIGEGLILPGSLYVTN